MVKMNNIKSLSNKQLKIQEHNTIKDVMFNIKAKECDVFVIEYVIVMVVGEYCVLNGG
jgi:hypothetical protein